MNKIKKFFIRVITKVIYFWGTLWYDKKYLTGKWFDHNHFSKGWFWILKYWFPQKILGYAKDISFPIPRGVKYSAPQNVYFHPDDMESMQSHGCYFQAIGAKIDIGKGTKIAPNCGFITANHNKANLEKHDEGKDIIIGENCWIGMNSVILPGVVLGKHTIVGAGSIVTKSFEKGNCIIAGNPAKVIKDLD